MQVQARSSQFNRKNRIVDSNALSILDVGDIDVGTQLAVRGTVRIWGVINAG